MLILQNWIYQTLNRLCETEKGIEWTAYGKTKVLADGRIEIVDLYIPPQESTGGDTELTPADQETAMLELLDRGEDITEWNCWIHSHHSMGLFWSKTDTDNFDSFDNGSKWWCHVVVADSGMKGAITQYKPFKVYDLDVPVQYYLPPENPKATEIDEKIKLYEEALQERQKLVNELEESILELEQEKENLTVIDTSEWEALIKERNRRKTFNNKSYYGKYGNQTSLIGGYTDKELTSGYGKHFDPEDDYDDSWGYEWEYDEPSEKWRCLNDGKLYDDPADKPYNPYDEVQGHFRPKKSKSKNKRSWWRDNR